MKQGNFAFFLKKFAFIPGRLPDICLTCRFFLPDIYLTFADKIHLPDIYLTFADKIHLPDICLTTGRPAENCYIT